MISHSELQALQTPRQLLGDELFTELQDLLLSIHRRGNTACRAGEHPCLIFNNSKQGLVAKVDGALQHLL